MAPVLERNIVEEFEIAVGSQIEAGRRSDGAEKAAEVLLRVAPIGRIGGGAAEPVGGRERIARVRVLLAPGYAQPSPTKFVYEVR